jgi:phage shock protein C
MLAGVCGGLGQYFNVNPTWVRIFFVLLELPGGVPGTVIYLVLWFVLPEEPGIG